MKYQLLLKDILRYTERANLQRERQDLLRAVEIMLVVPKAADDMMNVGRLNGFPGKLTAQGKLIKQGILLFCDLTPLLAAIDQERAADIIAQHEAARTNTTSPSSAKSADQSQSQDKTEFSFHHQRHNNHQSFSAANQPPLTSHLVGTSQMTDHSRVLLNQVLASNLGQLKLRERQTFLFEQTIIFSEVSRKGSSASHSGRHLPGATPTNYHPHYPHTHTPQGTIESCCTSTDCGLPPTPTLICDRPPTGPPLPPTTQSDDDDDDERHCAVRGGEPYHHHHYLGAPNNQFSGSSIPQYHSMPSYEYKNHLSINKIALIDKHYGPSVSIEQLYELLGGSLNADAESRRFMLKSRDPSQENVIYLLQTGCSFDRDDWVCSIRSMLECQLDFLRALQSPIAYQRGLTKEG